MFKWFDACLKIEMILWKKNLSINITLDNDIANVTIVPDDTFKYCLGCFQK